MYDDTNLAPHGLSSNPINVGQVFSHHNVYWGDLHSHSENSKDGAGAAETAFRYARDVSVLDFYALTDHGAGDWGPDGSYWEGLTAREWQENIALVEQYHEPGAFVTLLACEWSGQASYGHHNIFFRDLEGMPFGEDQYKKLEQVWSLLQKGEAFTVPHHTGIVWPGGSSPYVDWQAHRDDTLRPAIEIYSLWGSSEYLHNSMSYEHYHLRNFGSHDGRNYARDAWDLGHYVGSVGGSDDHNAKPGQAHGGLTAVLATQLDRDTIFDAILQRRTYATTGERILLSFTIDGRSMGERFQLADRSSPEIRVRVAGTDHLEFVELVKYDGKSWSVVLREEPDVKQTEINLTDEEFTRSALYYVRVKQRNIVHNREVRAWSSPIWVTEEDNPWWNQTRSTK